MTFSPMDTLDRMIWLADYPSHGAARFPDKPAIIADTGGYTYRELDQASDRFATFLLASGLKPGDRIAYWGKNNEMFFPVVFGCIRSGIVLVPLNWRCAPAEIAYMLADSGSKLLIHDKEFSDAADQATANLSAKPRHLVAWGGDDPATSLAAVINQGPVPAVHRFADVDACALMMYTSGTTGKPKGVMTTQRAVSIARHVEIDSPDWSDWNDDDIVLSAMPNFHSGGLQWMLTGLLRSLTCILTADPSPENHLALSLRYGCTRTFMVPTIVRGLLEALVASGKEAPGLKTISYGAAVMDVDLIKRCLAAFPDCKFAQYFGMTETAGTVTFLPPKDNDISRPELLKSIGKALPGYEIEIRDAAGKPLPANTPGEIWIKTPTVMLGYWNKPEATAEVLVEGWYRSGDGGYLNDAGYLFLTDRIKDMIVSGGENIYPAEVEAVMRLHPAIKDLVVIGAKDPKWGECVTAVVEWKEGKTAALEELRAFGTQHLASYKLPKRLYSVEVLPRTATGKLQRAEVRKRFAEGGYGTLCQ